MKEITDALEYLRNQGMITDEKYIQLQNESNLEVLKSEIISAYQNRKDVSSNINNVSYQDDKVLDEDIEILDVVDEISLLSVNDFKIDNFLFTKLNFSDSSIRIFKNDSGILGTELFLRIKEQPNYTDLFLNSINNQMFSEVVLIDYSNYNDSNVNAIKTIYNGKRILFSNMFNFYILRENNHDDVLARITDRADVQVIPFDNIYQDNFNDYEEIGESQSSSKEFQKSYSTAVGKLFSDENGFMNFLFISFLTGISVGIISMIFINFIA